MKKIGRNTKCPCDSGKKYKQCCLIKERLLRDQEENKYSKGQSESSDCIKICMEYLSDEYSNHTVINVTDDINAENYRTYQIKNYTNKIIMVAEKTDQNKRVFDGRGPENDMIIMYRGSYRTFRLNDMDKITESIDKMIQTRLAGKDDK